MCHFKEQQACLLKKMQGKSAPYSEAGSMTSFWARSGFEDLGLTCNSLAGQHSSLHALKQDFFSRTL